MSLLETTWQLLAALPVLPVKEEVGLGVAAFLTFVGMGLHWALPRQRMAAEELMKDGKLTEEQANRRIKIIAICAPTLTISGVLLLLTVLLYFAQ
jgi:hypothetical protein